MTDGPSNPKYFQNESSTAVPEGIDGAVWATPNLTRLDAFPDIKVALRSDWDKSKVAVVAGGGCGHEPMSAGYIGQGMLTAAVSGEVFASPSETAVLAALCAVTGSAGCLLLCLNYTGDRLNFTLAAQKARDLHGLQVEIVIIDDDVATSAKRAIAGTVLVQKIVGAAAEAGLSLAEVKKVAQDAVDNVASLGVSFSTCGRRAPERMALDEMEVGLGIHGEAGASREKLKPAGQIVDLIVDMLLTSDLSKHKLATADGYVALVNNLGAVPPHEMGVLTQALMKSKVGSKIKLLVGPAPLCTSLDMNGFSISLLRATEQFHAFLTAPTMAPAWPGANVPNPPAPVPMPFSLEDVSYIAKAVPSSDPKVEACFDKICASLIAAKAELDALDAIVGDGDCGSTMATGATRLMEEKGKLPLADPEKLCRCLSDVLSTAMGGSSGVLFRIMFLGMADFLKSSPGAWSESGGAALQAGLDAMMAAGGAQEGYRTMLDSLCPAARVLKDGGDLAAALAAAEAGAEKTKSMAARAGRSENVPEAVLKDTPDPGAVAVVKVIKAISEVSG